MPFAVLLDLVGHGLDAPVLAVEERAPVIGENRAEMLHEPLGLRVGNILTRDHHMLVKRHVVSTSVKAHFIGRAIAPSRPAHESLRGCCRCERSRGLIAGGASRQGRFAGARPPGRGRRGPCSRLHMRCLKLFLVLWPACPDGITHTTTQMPEVSPCTSCSRQPRSSLPRPRPTP